MSGHGTLAPSQGYQAFTAPVCHCQPGNPCCHFSSWSKPASVHTRQKITQGPVPAARQLQKYRQGVAQLADTLSEPPTGLAAVVRTRN